MNDSPPPKLRRPLVLIALFSFVQIFLVILNISLLPLILLLSLITGALLYTVFFKRKWLLAMLCAVLLVIPPISAGVSYYGKLLPAKEFAEKFGEIENALYTADIFEHTSYGNVSTSFAAITHIDGKALNDKVKARIVSYGNSYLRENSTIIFNGTPTFISDIQNKDFNTQLYLLGKNTFLSFNGAEIISAKKTQSTDIFAALRYRTKSILNEYFPFESQDDVNVSYAMFAGDSALIDSTTKDAFSKSGTLHILCVSGMHLVILCSFLSTFLKGITLSKKYRCLTIAAFCILYTAFTGFNLSTLRACIMCIITYVGLIFGKKAEAYISLFLSAYIITLISPFSLFDISLILSFCATLGIVVVSSLTPRAVHDGFIYNCVHSFAAALLCGIGAMCFTLPFCAFFFGTTSLYSVIATLVMSLPSEILLSLIFCLILLFPISSFGIGSTVLSILGYICACLSGLIIKIARFFAGLKYSSLTAIGAELFLVFFIVCFLLLSLAIAFSKIKLICLIATVFVFISAGNVFVSLIYSIKEDGLYKVYYYRKNEQDRLLSIKLGNQGYFLVNADNKLYTDSTSDLFDSSGKCNYLLIIPDEVIDTDILSRNILGFKEDFGIKKIYLPETKEGADLFVDLSRNGIECNFLPSALFFDKISMNFSFDGFNSIYIDDGEFSTQVVYAENYDKNYFYAYADKCMYLTRKTKNQFDTAVDIPPSCNEFYVRLARGEDYDGAVNLFGVKLAEIKR